MRRAQSVRHHSRASLSALSSTTPNANQFGTAGGQLALHADDLGVLREGDESDADVLRKQLLEKDRECDRVNILFVSLNIVSLLSLKSRTTRGQHEIKANQLY